MSVANQDIKSSDSVKNLEINNFDDVINP